jgi:predicted nucleotidyltransferase
MSAATPFDEVNRALDELTHRIRAQCGENLVGIYLQGSFAVGDPSPNSDIDLIIAVHRDYTEREIPQLQTLHGALYDELPPPWGQRIELSYAPVPILRRWSPTPRDPIDVPRSDDWRDTGTGSPPRVYPFIYLDNGARHLTRSEHDNTRVVRWVTREKGVTLTGPAPQSLIDPVSSADLAAETVELLHTVDDFVRTNSLKEGWREFFVTLSCRALHTLETGTVASKRVATEWALRTLDPSWHPLIEQSWAEWRDSRASLTIDPAQTVLMAEFVHYAREIADAKSAALRAQLQQRPL